MSVRYATFGSLAARSAFPRPGLRGIGITAAVAFLVLLIDAMVHPRAFFDLWLMQTVQRVEAPGLASLLRVVNDLTSSTGAVAMWVLAVVILAVARWWLPALAMLTLPVGGILNEGVGHLLVTRTRPHLAELTRGSGNHEERSFPSGHVTGAVLFYGLVFVLAGRIRDPLLRRMVRVAALGPLVLVGFARVWDGAHWPTDVLGAYALGMALLAGLVALYRRLDAAVGALPFIHAATLAHNEARPHAHALTSLVLFDGDRVIKVYAPGFVPRAIYWLAFQAPFAYATKRVALEAAMHRRNLTALLTEYWYGGSRVARVTGIETVAGQPALVSERVDGHAPRDRAAARAFLRDLQDHFEEAGLPTWQIDPRQPRAVDNVLETSDGTWRIVDLESGLVSPMASLRTWGRALRRGLLPFYDEVFFDVTRTYIEREATALATALGPVRFAELTTTLDAAERTARAWQASEPRLWSRLARGILTGFGACTWKARTHAMFAKSNGLAMDWTERAVATWEAEGRISGAEAAALRAQIAAPTFQLMVPYLGAHILVSIPLRFPLGTIARPLMVLGALGVATVRFLRREIDGGAWRLAWSIHSPLVIALSAIPGVGSFAYLAAKPVRANRLLLRTVTDAALLKAPRDLYERTGLRRRIARPVAPNAVVNI
ncbi:MAG: phosphatase PAP2 family protein, partial [Chloroflexia bacterium]|nr:phosphatase PAP2 family protein [Chloroflexia bacterium]